MRRLKTAFALLAAALLCLLGYFSYRKAGFIVEEETLDRAERPVADIAMKSPHFVEMRGERMVLVIDAEEARYFREGDSADLTLPRMVYRDEGGRQTRFDGNRGIVNTVTNDLTLEGEVRVLLPDGSRLETPSLSYRGDRKTVTGEGAVRLSGKGFEIKGVGMRVELENERYLIRRKVEAIIDPAFFRIQPGKEGA